eukprot:scaffold275888_cov39-Attheya_sp.AAC.2
MGTYATGSGFHDRSGDNEFQGGATAGGGRNKPHHPCIDCGEYDHKTSKSRKCEKNADFDPQTAAKRCSDCKRQGHVLSRSKLCPKHTSNLPISEEPTGASPALSQGQARDYRKSHP